MNEKFIIILFYFRILSFLNFFLLDQLSTVEIPELLLMEAEMAVSSRLVELSDMNVVRDIDYQDLLIEHVKQLENGLVIKLCVKVKLLRKYLSFLFQDLLAPCPIILIYGGSASIIEAGDFPSILVSLVQARSRHWY